MKRSTEPTPGSDQDRQAKHPRLGSPPPPPVPTLRKMEEPPATPPSGTPSTPGRKTPNGSGTFNPQRSPSNTIKIQGLNGHQCARTKGKLGSVAGIGMGNAKGLDGKGAPAKATFGAGFTGRANETKKLVVKNALCWSLLFPDSCKTADDIRACDAGGPNGATSASSDTYVSNSLATLTRSVRAITAVPPERTPESLQTLYGLCEGALSGGSAHYAAC